MNKATDSYYYHHDSCDFYHFLHLLSFQNQAVNLLFPTLEMNYFDFISSYRFKESCRIISSSSHLNFF